MKSIGPTLREARVKRGVTRREISGQTKIKEQFVWAIENEKWGRLPEYPVVLGFVSNLAKTLGFDEERMIALLRRDYPPKKLFVNPKPEIKEKFVWGPRLTFLLGSILVLIMIGSYLGYQYFQFVALPKVLITAPKESEKVAEGLVKVNGKTDPDVSVSVNNQPALVNDSGEFVTEIIVDKNVSEIVVIAKTRAGRETVLKQKIVVESESQ